MLGALVASATPVMVTSPAQAQTLQNLPFWSRPYPYYYAPARPNCSTIRREVTAEGEVRYVRVWACNPFDHAPS